MEQQKRLKPLSRKGAKFRGRGGQMKDDRHNFFTLIKLYAIEVFSVGTLLVILYAGFKHEIIPLLWK
jgi:hypothetical protein